MATSKFRLKIHLSVFLVTVCVGLASGDYSRLLSGLGKNSDSRRPVVLILDGNVQTKDSDYSRKDRQIVEDFNHRYPTNYFYKQGQSPKLTIKNSQRQKKFKPKYDQRYLRDDRYDQDRHEKRDRDRQYQQVDRDDEERRDQYKRQDDDIVRLINADDILERHNRNDHRYYRDRQDQDRYDREDQDRRDRQEERRDRDNRDRRDRLDDDREDRKDRDRRQDRLESSRLRHGLRLGLQHRPGDRNQVTNTPSPIIKSLLRISNVLRCGARDKCEEECNENRKAIARSSNKDCEDECDKRYECEDDYEDETEKGQDCGQQSISTKGERYVK